MFFKKTENHNENEGLIKVAALLIHVAKVDEDYSQHEEEIIKKTLLELGASEKNINDIINYGTKIEKDSN